MRAVRRGPQLFDRHHLTRRAGSGPCGAAAVHRRMQRGGATRGARACRRAGTRAVLHPKWAADNAIEAAAAGYPRALRKRTGGGVPGTGSRSGRPAADRRRMTASRERIMSWDKLKDLVLVNDRVELRRVRFTDRPGFERIVFDPEIWKYFVARVGTQDELDDFLESAVVDTLRGTRIVFAIIDRASGEIVGSSAYGNLAEAERRVEIGWSWLGAQARRTGINRAAKFALLEHAFDELDCERVEFKTDVLNTPARTALSRLGATEEGVLRSFNYMPGGRRRDVIYYSILRREWPDVRVNLRGVAGA
ncbi:GNAT family N-acetyltransferase [Nocardia arthritidis]|uniref:GNAT family N-acetyltransferase n=2 Tax=Nocardia arthritidis TaxID=228602 RepID=A0A6G9Y893_9NOCA|nr:GNAT family N-acetyltransferase [Nocardia arthritidis]